MASGSPASSSVHFPGNSDQQQIQQPQLRGPHLPFRRISLPTAPSLLHRLSVASVLSYDSLAEDHGDGIPASPSRQVNAGMRSRARPGSVESPRKKHKSAVVTADDKKIAKRQSIIQEFHETEKAYMDGLELIYSHFLTPIIVSLDTPEPILNRQSLTSIFSNFIDIWNLHRSFLFALSDLLQSPSPTAPPLSPLLLSHFPYLSLYTPFVTAFPSTISALTELITPPSASRPNPSYSSHFACFLSQQEADPRCRRLRLRDWLLTIVQRCPRYLLLLKDLINCTERSDPEHAQLTAVHTLVSKITLSLNTSLHAHAQTLALLALQRATPNLPFQLISPGRTFLRRGTLLQLEGSGTPQEREFLLFSDCLIWLAYSEGSGTAWDWSWSGSGSGSGYNGSKSAHNTPAGSKITSSSSALGSNSTPPPMKRNRSKSETELPTLSNPNPGSDEVFSLESAPSTPQKLVKRKSHYYTPPPPPPNMVKRHASTDDKFTFKGKLELVDLDVVVGSALDDERRFEILSPEASFALYSASEEERDEWTSEIRAAKAQLLVSLNVTNPNSTLTSSSSTNHVRKALQALPYPPSDERIATLRASQTVDSFSSVDSPLTKSATPGKRYKGKATERRRKVDHWIPAVWVPDEKTSACMRCGRAFGWRRRRHHCRLCGRCVCAGCSGRTFFISDSNNKEEANGKPARACDACYESVFPLVDPVVLPPSERADKGEEPPPSSSQRSSDDYPPHPSPSLITSMTTNDLRGKPINSTNPGQDTIASLAHLPSWLSMPSLPIHQKSGGPQALMAIDLNSPPTFASASFEGAVADLNHMENKYMRRNSHSNGGGDGQENEWEKGRVRKMKSHARVRSTQQILEDFRNVEAESVKLREEGFGSFMQEESDPFDFEDEDEEDDDEGGIEEEFHIPGVGVADGDNDDADADFFTPPHSPSPSSPLSSPRKPRPYVQAQASRQLPQRREDTARRSKRFSLPALALQTTNVTARSTEMGGGGADAVAYLSEALSLSNVQPRSNSSLNSGFGFSPESPTRVVKAKRFSLVLQGGGGGGGGGKGSRLEGGRENDLAKGLAVAKLSELLAQTQMQGRETGGVRS